MTINLKLNGPIFSDELIDPFIVGDADSDARFLKMGYNARGDSDPKTSVDLSTAHLDTTSRAWSFDKRGNLLSAYFNIYNAYRELIVGTKEKSVVPIRRADPLDQLEHYMVIFSEDQLQTLLAHYNGRLIDEHPILDSIDDSATGDRSMHFNRESNYLIHKIEFPNDELPTTLRVIPSATDPVDGTTLPRLYFTENDEKAETNRRVKVIRNTEGEDPVSAATIAAVMVCIQEVMTSATRFGKAQNDLLGSIVKTIKDDHDTAMDLLVKRVNASLTKGGLDEISSDDLTLDFGTSNSAPYSFPERDGGKHLSAWYRGETELRRLVSAFNLDDLHEILTTTDPDQISPKAIRKAWISLTDSYIARHAEADALEVVEPIVEPETTEVPVEPVAEVETPDDQVESQESETQGE